MPGLLNLTLEDLFRSVGYEALAMQAVAQALGAWMGAFSQFKKMTPDCPYHLELKVIYGNGVLDIPFTVPLLDDRVDLWRKQLLSLDLTYLAANLQDEKPIRLALRAEVAKKAIERILIPLSEQFEYMTEYIRADPYARVVVSSVEFCLRAAVVRLQDAQEHFCMLAILEQVLCHGSSSSEQQSAPLANDEYPSDVVEDCTHLHTDPAAKPDVTDAVIADVMWATHQESVMQMGSVTSPPQSAPTEGWAECDVDVQSEAWTSRDHTAAPKSSEYGDIILIVRLTRCGKEVRKVLHEGSELELIRAYAEEEGYSCRMSSGASIFVYPNQYRTILQVLPDTDLRPHHVVVSEAFLPLICEAISSLPSKLNVRPSSTRTFALVEGENAEEIVVVERSFFNSKPYIFQKAQSVTQSDSAAHHVMDCRRPALQ
mmetsp:Transcript_110383/g.235744  ORF Transcript_110383/g.235744 Transcript_110383/m.235744 type:complete len:428 (-) Transcript_110383:322-1605(-)